MPLGALLDGNKVQSFDFDTESWHELKRTYSSRTLLTTCCDQPAVPYTSQLGTFYFAHKRRGECATDAETAEHLLAKIEIAKAVRAARWDVATEVRGQTPDGQAWIADVLASRGTKTVAFEIQWSGQTHERTRERQGLYKASGVRGAWLRRVSSSVRDRRGKLLEEEATPEFAIRLDSRTRSFRVPRFDIDLKAFVHGMVSGRLEWWGPSDGSKVDAYLLVGQVRCPRCSRYVHVATGLRVSSPQFGHLEDIYVSSDADSRTNKIMAYMLRTQERLNEVGIGAFQRQQRQRDKPYVSSCRFCATELSRDVIFRQGVKPEVSSLVVTLVLGTDLDNAYREWRFRGRSGRWKY